jgi:hypothetical protein
MATRNNGDGDKRKKKQDDDLHALYQQYRKDFTAADLQKYTVEEKGIPATKVLAEMEKIHREFVRKKKK